MDYKNIIKYTFPTRNQNKNHTKFNPRREHCCAPEPFLNILAPLPLQYISAHILYIRRGRNQCYRLPIRIEAARLYNSLIRAQCSYGCSKHSKEVEKNNISP